MKTETLVEIISDGLDAVCDGRGFGAEHLAAVNLANAAPELLEACKSAERIIGEYRQKVMTGKITGDLIRGDCEPYFALCAAIAKAERSAQ